MNYKKELKEHGYVIIENVLSEEEINKAKELFYEWKNKIPNIDKFHKTINPHGIFKFHEVGHQKHAWYLRTRPQIIKIFKDLWETDELIVSFDGCCHIPKEWDKKNSIWTHTDQSPVKKGLHCYQSFISLTSNSERTLVVYEGSHEIHEHYFKVINDEDNSSDWQMIDINFLEEIEDSKKVLNVPAGGLVIWDSRIFHQNQYGKAGSEERLIQYLCYLPKNVKSNTETMIKKRRKYFDELRTTSHWPSPIHVVPKNPYVYGNTEYEIDYDLLEKPDLSEYMEEIEKLL